MSLENLDRYTPMDICFSSNTVCFDKLQNSGGVMVMKAGKERHAAHRPWVGNTPGHPKHRGNMPVRDKGKAKGKAQQHWTW